ncbi:MAG: ice-binding family protein, partial [Nitrosotalea sp.]
MTRNNIKNKLTMNRNNIKNYFVMSVLILSASSMIQNNAFAATAPNLGTSSTFGVLAATTVTNDPTLGAGTVITGDLGISPNGLTSITGFPPGTVTGSIEAGNAAAAQAQTDAHAAFAALNSQACTTTYPPVQDLGGKTLTPGVYCDSTSFSINAGETLTLNGAGVYIFKAGSTLVTVTGANVVLTGGATAANVFWAVGSSATLAAPGSVATSPTHFEGTIIALTSISETGGTTGTHLDVNCGLIALNGAVTLASSTSITVCNGGTGGNGQGNNGQGNNGQGNNGQGNNGQGNNGQGNNGQG